MLGNSKQQGNLNLALICLFVCTFFSLTTFSYTKGVVGNWLAWFVIYILVKAQYKVHKYINTSVHLQYNKSVLVFLRTEPFL